MARFDKYDPVSGGFRARLGFAPVAADVGAVIAVGLDGNGQAVRAAAAADVVGVVCFSRLHSEGDVVDVMTAGEIVDVTDGNVSGAAAGSLASAADDAVVAGGAGTRVGHFVEAWRLVVRVAQTAVGA